MSGVEANKLVYVRERFYEPPEDEEFSECYESVNSGLILEYLKRLIVVVNCNKQLCNLNYGETDVTNMTTETK